MRTRNRACSGYDLAWACLVLTFLPVTFEVIANSYTVLPYYDGWVAVLPPEGWGDLLFSPHNEYRIGLIMLRQPDPGEAPGSASDDVALHTPDGQGRDGAAAFASLAK